MCYYRNIDPTFSLMHMSEHNSRLVASCRIRCLAAGLASCLSRLSHRRGVPSFRPAVPRPLRRTAAPNRARQDAPNASASEDRNSRREMREASCRQVDVCWRCAGELPYHMPCHILPYLFRHTIWHATGQTKVLRILTEF